MSSMISMAKFFLTRAGAGADTPPTVMNIRVIVFGFYFFSSYRGVDGVI